MLSVPASTSRLVAKVLLNYARLTLPPLTSSVPPPVADAA
jgi:hypothetical protein